MVRNIILGLVVVALVALGYVAYLDMKAKRSLLSGDVFAGPSETANISRPVPTGGATTASNAVTRPTPLSAAAGSPAASDVSMPVPSGDTISPSPPNGTVFAASGRYGVYRQGNITWRIDTQTGTSCILFATNEEWRKPQVYQHGCETTIPR